MSRVTLRTLLAPLLLAAALGGCGRQAGTTASEPWPILLSPPGVVGYAATRLSDSARDDTCRALFDFVPAGIDADRPIVELGLDAKAYGGAYAVMLPLRDAGAFRSSLDAAPALAHVGSEDYRLDLAPESRLREVKLFLSALGGGPTSIMDAVRAIQDASPQSITFNLQFEGSWALVAPTFEAGSVCRDVLHETGGFVAAPRCGLVVSVDVARLRTVYAAELQRYEDQFKGLIGGAQAAGLLGLAASLHGDRESQAPPLDLGVKWEFVWAVKDMLDLSNFTGLQVQLPELGSAPHDESVAPAGDSGSELDPSAFWSAFKSVDHGTLRVIAAEGAPLAAVAAALRPAPDLPHATVALAADGPALAHALADWMHPLGRLVMGEGPPCDRYLGELAAILSSSGGTFALMSADNRPCLLVAGGHAPPDLLPRLKAWIAPLLDAAGASRAGGQLGGLSAHDLTDGRTLLVGADGVTQASLGRHGDVLWLRDGDAPEPETAVAEFQAALDAPPPSGGPAAWLRSGALRTELHAAGRELRIDVQRADHGR